MLSLKESNMGLFGYFLFIKFSFKIFTKTEIMSRQTSNTWLHIKMESGKNREIRRVMQKFDLRVNRLKRISFGPYRIGRV